MQYEVLQEQEWSVRLVLGVVLALGVCGSHAVLGRWGIARQVFDFGLVQAAAGLDVVRCRNWSLWTRLLGWRAWVGVLWRWNKPLC